MKFYSTNNSASEVDFREAVFKSFPADKGLYMPAYIPKLDERFLRRIENYPMQEIAYRVSHALLQDSIPSADLRKIVNDAIDFPAPVVKLDEKTHVVELFHGPSLAFKDFGARFMSRVMSHCLEDVGKVLDVLVATSGDTGGAVALGFLGIPNTRVTILYPRGKVSAIQELQLTTCGGNIRAIELEGSFDDCQALVKRAFVDAELNKAFQLTSANSINIARLIPQTFYYFNAFAELKKQGLANLVISVPSGNFGNLAAGLLAWKMGLPVSHFLAATNVNDTVPKFLRTGAYHPRKSVPTISNAMDVGSPSNWVRIMDMFKDHDRLGKMVTGYSFTDTETLNAIGVIFERYRYVACPHTAIGWLALEKWKSENPANNSTGIFLSTAHPCKFPDVFPDKIAHAIKPPESVKHLTEQERRSVRLANDFAAFKALLLETII
ncbi:MAG TPA: threonine synthase [Sphingobacteriaceae bacterium]